jgi:hypothetical protein
MTGQLYDVQVVVGMLMYTTTVPWRGRYAPRVDEAYVSIEAGTYRMERVADPWGRPDGEPWLVMVDQPTVGMPEAQLRRWSGEGPGSPENTPALHILPVGGDTEGI